MRSTSPNSKAVIAATICAFVILLPTAAIFQTACGDTFVHKETRETFDGVVGDAKINNKSLVIREDGARVYLDLSEYEITRSDKGTAVYKKWSADKYTPTDDEAYAALVGLKGMEDFAALPTVKYFSPWSLAFSSDGKLLAAACRDLTVKVWKTETRKSVSLAGHTNKIKSVAFSPDGRLLASGSFDGTAKLWDVEKYKCIATLGEDGHSAESVAFSADGKLLATGGTGGVKLWDVATYRSLSTFPGKAPVVFSPRGTLFVGGGPVKEWDVRQGRCIATFQQYQALSLALSPDGRLLAVGSYGGITVWDVNTQRCVARLEPQGMVRSLAFSPDGRLLAWGVVRGGINLWDVSQQRCTARLKGGYNDFPLAFNPASGWSLLATTQNGVIKLWKLHSDKLRVGGQSVDWTPGKPAGPPFPESKLEVLSEMPMIAGNSVWLRIAVSNEQGAGDLFCLMGMIDSRDIPSWKNKPVLFGRISAGKSKSREILLPTAPRLSAGTKSFSIRFEEQHGNVPASLEGRIEIGALARPKLAVSIQILDGTQGKAGNGDGRLQRGEAAECLISVTNIGKGITGEIELAAGVPLLRGLTSYGQTSWRLAPGLKPGRLASAQVTLQVQQTFAPKDFTLKLSAKESLFDISAQRDVTIEVGEPLERQPVAFSARMLAAKGGANVYGGSSKTTDWLGKVDEGKVVQVTGLLGDFYRIELEANRHGWVPADRLVHEQRLSTPPPAGPTVISMRPRRSEAPPPVVMIVSPDDGQFTAQQSLGLELKARADGGLGSVKIVIDGQNPTTAPLTGKRQTWKATIALKPGVNNITVTVTDTLGQQDIETVRVKYMPDLPSLVGFYDRVWAVVIAADKYKDKAVPALNCAVKDGRAVADILRKEFFVSKVITLFNEEATFDNINKVLLGELRDAGKRDGVLIYFAGHGITIDEGQGPVGYIIPYDGGPDRLDTSFSMLKFKEEVAKVCRAKDLLVVADSCYGGLLTTRGIEVVERKKDDVGEDKYLQWLRGRRWRGVMTAGGPDERVLDGGPGGHSTFTGPFLQALKSSHDYITASQLFTNLKPAVEKASTDRGRKHTPRWGSWFEDGDFVFIRK
ncbi:MAG: caspase family protein [Planctomycetes bacterium]|nr:caspase family protein [Planctomycetota bacterium]